MLAVVVIDNYDSFTYNLVQYFGELGARVTVFRNDAIAVRQLAERSPERIVISPGPCTPDQSGISRDVIRWFAGRIPVLGVCLGHQAIGQVFGGKVVRAPRVMHGKTSAIFHDGTGIFRHIPSPFEAMRYHSLLLDKTTIPVELEVSAWTADGEVMGVRHKTHAIGIDGVQFHPESILTVHGKQLLLNFLQS